MSISDYVWMALKNGNKTQVSLMKEFGFASRQSMSNKFQKDSWTANDLARVAEFTGGKLVIMYPNGSNIVIEPAAAPEKKQEKPDGQPE